MEIFDVIVIGAGSGGYAAAIKCAQHGMRVAIVDRGQANNQNKLGGVCLNTGCIPLKIMLNIAQKYLQLQQYNKLGIELDNVNLNLKKIYSYKKDIIENIEHKMRLDLQKYGIIHFVDDASLTRRTASNQQYIYKNKPHSNLNENKLIEVHLIEKKINIYGKNIILATGSKNITLEKSFSNKFWSSDNILTLKKIPKNILIIGSGYIGIQLSFLLQALGSKVILLDKHTKFLTEMDCDVSEAIMKNLTEHGVKIILNHTLVEEEFKKQMHYIKIENLTTKAILELKVENILIAIGRRPCLDGLFKDIKKRELDIKINERGFVIVNSNFQTTEENIFAIGNIIKGPGLANKAEEEAIFLADFLSRSKADFLPSNNQDKTINYNLIPHIIAIMPEVSSIGICEKKSEMNFNDYKIGRVEFDFDLDQGINLMNNSKNFIKIITDKQDKILGCHIVGQYAGFLIHEVAAIMNLGGTIKDLAKINHSHPTPSEALRKLAHSMLNIKNEQG